MSNEVTPAPSNIAARVDVADNTTNVYAGAAQLVGVHVQVLLSAHACPIEDSSGGTVLFTIPADAKAGSWHEAGNMRFPNGLFVNPDDVGTGIVTVVYIPDHGGLAGSGAGLP